MKDHADMPAFKNLHAGIEVKKLIMILLMIFAAALPLHADDKTYYIGPRDVLRILIFAGGKRQHEVSVTVSSSGTINVPYIGLVSAKGLTIPQLEEKIIKPLAKSYFVDPEVNINVLEYHSIRYYISGAVRNPGLYETDARTTLLRLIAKAGGALPDKGDFAFILRDEMNKEKDPRVPVKVDIEALIDRGDLSQDRALESGDVVYIPHDNALDIARSSIYVEGEVRNPGVYPFQPGITALNACIMAGGFAKFAAPSRATIIRGQGEDRKVMRIDLEDVKKGKTADVKLKPGDMVNVPETWF